MADDMLISPEHIASRDPLRVWVDTSRKPTVFDLKQGMHVLCYVAFYDATPKEYLSENEMIWINFRPDLSTVQVGRS